MSLQRAVWPLWFAAAHLCWGQFAVPDVEVLDWDATDPPCFPAHDLVPQLHVAPRAPRIALLVMSFTDVDSPKAEEVAAFYQAPAVREFLATVSSGCLDVTLVPIPVELSLTEKDEDGKCRIVHSEDLEGVNLPSLPALLDGGSVKPEFYTTWIMPVAASCTTSGGAGLQKLTVQDAKVEFTGMFFGHALRRVSWEDRNLNDEGLGFYGSQKTYIHELFHLLGYQYHSNAYQCSDPLAHPDVLKCPTLEYGDLYDIMGKSTGYLKGFHARGRYHMGWLGKGNITVIQASGTYTIRPINEVQGALRAAVVAGKDLWLEYRTASDTAAETGSALSDHTGLYVRHENKLVDASLGSCASKDDKAWIKEMRSVSLSDGRALVLRSLGVIIGDATRTSSSMSFSVFYTGLQTICEQELPEISEGLWGEWKYISATNPNEERGNLDLAAALKAKDPLSSYSRSTVHLMNGLKNRDSSSCEISDFSVRLVSKLPQGWAFATRDPVAVEPGESQRVEFGFGIPDDAADGDYDFCVAAQSYSGLYSAKLFRLTLPEADLQWYTNNRPLSSGVDETVRAACEAAQGCADGYPSCSEPVRQCETDLQCGGDDWSAWSRCWKTDSKGVRSRGKDFCDVRQSYCQLASSASFLDQEACDEPELPPCLDQDTCRVNSAAWEELKEGESSTTCSGQKLCGRGGEGVGEPVCKDFWSSGDMKSGHVCRGDETCVRALCENSPKCAGYVKSKSRNKVWLFQEPLSPADASSNYECWVKPAGAPTCSCFGSDQAVIPDSTQCRALAPAPTPETTTAPSPDAPEAPCDETLRGEKDSGYRGCQQATTTGKTCQKWTSQSPHAHSRTTSNPSYAGTGLGGHNYCRNPDGENTIWCYTTDPDHRWEFCEPLAPALLNEAAATMPSSLALQSQRGGLELLAAAAAGTALAALAVQLARRQQQQHRRHRPLLPIRGQGEQGLPVE